MEKMKRTATCGSLRASDDGKTVILNGWVHRNRDHGGIHFINLRDRYGETQIVVDEDVPAPLAELAGSLKFEYCVAIEGLVRKRPDSMINPDMPTGEIEISVKNIEVLNTSLTLPFMVEDETDSNETARLKYRYLDLRSKGMQNRIILRNKVTYALREYLQKDDFLEIETPTLIKSTPEGARDFLVPSRLHAGKFFALPQSPQLYKQLLMVSGFDKYFQVARCYRDEDARGDRQLEFTQIDIEMSFVSKDDIFAVAEGMMGHIFKEALNTELPVSFERLPYDDAMNLYGSDKPDLRFGLAFQDFASFVPGSEFSVFKSVLESDGVVKAMVVPGAAADYSRKKISDLEETAKTFGAKGLAWMKVTAEGLDGGISKFFTAQADEIKKGLGASEGDLILLMAANWKTACNSLGAVRSRLGKDLSLIDESQFKFVWIVDFPLFEYNEEDQAWEPAHHMFSMPQDQYLDTFETDPGPVKGDLYDLVLNGYELASGSIRVHDPELQQKIFNVVGFPKEIAEERFGFLLESFRYGAPPHGGIAAGLDRLVMIMAGKSSIKEVIPFPKNSAGMSPMDDSPAIVDTDQLQDLHLQVIMPPEED
ncbi:MULTISPECIES: aspartate--tRNA ligase [unclassified Oceanispirochaeta]|uniref:aspartate--tRNA ligase n=1 Tax=unclassified Oceanispirochaeta TaxID=2635722 RepID=UPI000E099C1C|nr:MULTISPECIES: aspartate--tRNA ligase [unclassified Oceanispirochaeta]MBF9015365.1 aspartate--tRNA ligase [Oceanispirochaeta sp. M2]NPD71824.1 aspartate--tRNA ligase [Oceanispirochaeta sp. M1]RDG32635.1 aspartate--tRNA ligase [Oceanispirochaeta sp. M1]